MSNLPTGPLNTIKAQILINLQALVTAGVLGGVIEQYNTANPIDLDMPAYPAAILGSSNMKSKYEYQQANKRTYTFDILIIQKVDNLPSSNPGYMEDLRDAIALRFDNNFTLAGAAPLGIEGVPSEKRWTTQQGKNYVTFWITLKCNTLANLTYNF